MLLEWALPLGVASIDYFHIEMLCNSFKSMYHLQIQPYRTQHTSYQTTYLTVLICMTMYDKKGGFPLKTTACAGGPPSGQRDLQSSVCYLHDFDCTRYSRTTLL